MVMLTDVAIGAGQIAGRSVLAGIAGHASKTTINWDEPPDSLAGVRDRPGRSVVPGDAGAAALRLLGSISCLRANPAPQCRVVAAPSPRAERTA